MDNPKKLTVISHVFNEEYLIRFWLEYHSKIFDHGIIIDYDSSDNTVQIVKEICPTWQVVKTKNLTEHGAPHFDATAVDKEVIEYENMIEGFKLALNTTEFLVLENGVDNFRKLLNNNNKVYKIKFQSVLTSKKDYFPLTLHDFFNSIDCVTDLNRGFRYLHSYKSLKYKLGRHDCHFEENPIELQGVFGFHCANMLLNKRMIFRRVQIHLNSSAHDRHWGAGKQHFVDLNTVYGQKKNFDKKCNEMNNSEIEFTNLFKNFLLKI